MLISKRQNLDTRPQILLAAIENLFFIQFRKMMILEALQNKRDNNNNKNIETKNLGYARMLEH